MFSRLKILLGDDIQKLHSSKVIIFGVGGVGGYTLEMLCRSGVGTLAIVDFDTVDITNKNRQIIALDSTISKYKVDVWGKRLKDINPNINLIKFNRKLTPDNIEDFNLKDYDYIIDAIDMVSSKTALIEYAYKNNLNIISAMGAGNRIGIPNFEVMDLFKTSNDGLAKVLRHNLRKLGVDTHTVVCTRNIADAKGQTIGSIAYYPAMCGCVLSAYVIDKLIKEKSL